jgi:RNA polymerase sigma-70 factor (ECF subfamily)
LNYTQLIEQCIKGNRADQKRLYENLAPQLYPVALRYAVDTPHAHDLLQDTFVQIFQSLEQLKNPDALLFWAKRICTNKGLAQWKNKHRWLLLEENIPEGLCLEEESAEEWEELPLALIQEAIDSLPPGYKIVFHLYVLEEMSHQDIATQLNIDAGTSRSQLFKAKKMLKKNLEPHLRDQPQYGKE